MRNFLLKLVINESFDLLILMLVAANTILMVIGLMEEGPEPAWVDSVLSFLTYSFIIEAVLKILALGVNNYIRDFMNIFDLALVIVSVVELQMASSGGKQDLKFLQTFRMLRVLRVTRLIRRLKYMQVLIRVMRMSFNSALSIGLLLLIMMSIFAVLGMNIYKGKLLSTRGIFRQSFENVLDSYMAIF